MNLPNKLTVLRVLLVPVFVLVMTLGLPFPASNIAAAAVFLVTSLTDMLDGKIARKYNLVTDFGKLMDPVADKFMVFSAMIVITSSDAFAFMRPVMIWATLIVIFRELGVTSLRMVVSGKANATALAANMLGKIKTVSQVVFIMIALLEPVILGDLLGESLSHLFTYISLAFMVVMTVWSGVNYVIGYSKYISTK